MTQGSQVGFGLWLTAGLRPGTSSEVPSVFDWTITGFFPPSTSQESGKVDVFPADHSDLTHCEHQLISQAGGGSGIGGEFPTS